jgi:hypothetical protein
MEEQEEIENRDRNQELVWRPKIRIEIENKTEIKIKIEDGEKHREQRKRL